MHPLNIKHSYRLFYYHPFLHDSKVFNHWLRICPRCSLHTCTQVQSCCPEAAELWREKSFCSVLMWSSTPRNGLGAPLLTPSTSSNTSVCSPGGMNTNLLKKIFAVMMSCRVSTSTVLRSDFWVSCSSSHSVTSYRLEASASPLIYPRFCFNLSPVCSNIARCGNIMHTHITIGKTTESVTLNPRWY